ERIPAVRPPQHDGKRWLRLAVVLVILAPIAGWWILTSKRSSVRPAEISERESFRIFERACRTGDPHAVFRALLNWIDCLFPDDASPGLDDLAAGSGDQQLAGELDALENAAWGAPASRREWSAERLLQGARAVRSRLKQNTTEARREALPSLNPQAP